MKKLVSSLIIVSLLILTGCSSKTIIKQTIESHPGEYRIIRQRLNSIGDGGKNDDYMVVDQNGVIYTVYARDNQIVEDQYESAKAGQDRALKFAEPFLTGKKYRIFGTDTGNEFRVKLVLFEETSDVHWLYDLYDYMYHNEVHSSLHVIIYNESEESVTRELENGYNSADTIFLVTISDSPELTVDQLQTIANNPSIIY